MSNLTRWLNDNQLGLSFTLLVLMVLASLLVKDCRERVVVEPRAEDYIIQDNGEPTPLQREQLRSLGVVDD